MKKKVWLEIGHVTNPELYPERNVKYGDPEYQFSDGPAGERGSSADYVDVQQGIDAHADHDIVVSRETAKRLCDALTALHDLTVWAGHRPDGRGSWAYVNATVVLCRVTGKKYQDTHYPPTDSTPKEESTP